MQPSPWERGRPAHAPGWPLFRIWPVLAALALLAPPAAAQGIQDRVVERAAITDKDCLDCHGNSGFAVPTGSHGDTVRKRLDVAASSLKQSVHGKLACLDCHTAVERLPHGKEAAKLKAADCVGCHKDQRREAAPLLQAMTASRLAVGLPPAEATPAPISRTTSHYLSSVHAQPRKDDPAKPNADCRDCHGTHYVYKPADSDALTNVARSPDTCGACHVKELALHKESVHGAARLTPWKGRSATCSDCHTAHEVPQGKTLTARRVVTQSCGNCHETALKSYLDTYHGQLAWLGGKEPAKCHDCHRSHDTRKVADPADGMHDSNRLGTCRECHKSATASLLGFAPHATTQDFAKFPEMWLVGKGMVVLVVAVLIFFYAHSVLWFRRSWQLTGRLRPTHHATAGEPHFQRFSPLWRANHWLLVTSVLTLVFTGMTAKFAEAPWAEAIAAAISPETLAVIHRVAAVGFLGAVIGHTVAVLVRVGRDRSFRWFGPDSLLPRWKDWDDMKGMFLWFLGRSPQPRLDRWTYWEKFDYWAVYWGAIVIGVSGLILWFNDLFARLLPGWVFNVATLAHGVEAFLAVTSLFVVHFFNNHFRPGKFPLDTVMFVGSWPLHELKEERPEEYQRLLANGQLEGRLVPPPSRRALVVSHVLGFGLIGTGLLLLVLVIAGFVQKGLV